MRVLWLVALKWVMMVVPAQRRGKVGAHRHGHRFEDRAGQDTGKAATACRIRRPAAGVVLSECRPCLTRTLR